MIFAAYAQGVIRKLAAVLTSMTLLAPLPAQAHTSLVNSAPAKNSTVKVMPKTIALTFDEKLIKLAGKNVSKFSVIGPDGKEIKLGPITLTNQIISAAVLEPKPKPGIYKINYRVISGDGHPVSGAIKFTLKN